GAASEEPMGISESAENQVNETSAVVSVSEAAAEEMAPEPLPATEEQFMETAAPEVAIQQTEEL
ncbi:MAG: hypothetical protein ACKO9S_11735, partial [Bacteroidota bacterium]